MILTFSTTPTRSHLREAIKSALIQSSNPAALSIRILVDDPDVSFLPPELQGMAIPHTPEFRNRIYRITANHLRALKCVAEGPDHYGVICEDDILFAPGWDRRALETATALNLSVLTLCSAHELDLFDAPRSGAMRFKNTERFYGQQAVLWSKQAACLCADQLEQKLRASKGELNVPWLIDGATRTFCKDNGVDVWATNPSLVKHVGYVSAWESVSFPKTLRFVG